MSEVTIATRSRDSAQPIRMQVSSLSFLTFLNLELIRLIFQNNYPNSHITVIWQSSAARSKTNKSVSKTKKPAREKHGLKKQTKKQYKMQIKQSNTHIPIIHNSTNTIIQLKHFQIKYLGPR